MDFDVDKNQFAGGPGGGQPGVRAEDPGALHHQVQPRPPAVAG